MKRNVNVWLWSLLLSLGCAAKAPKETKAEAPAAVAAPVEATATPPVVETEVKEAAPAPAPVAPAEPMADTPTTVIQKYIAELRGIVDPTERAQKGVRDPAKEQKIAEKVRQFFDFPTLAKMSLGRHWSRITQAQRDEFSTLFIALVEDSYLRRSRDIIGNYQIKYGKEILKGNYARVTTNISRSDADVDIVYELHKNPNWMIYNIILDNVDLIRNYQSQFNSIIGKSSFAELLKKMRKKQDESGDDDDVTL